MTEKKMLILGVGNLLLSDEGVGIHVVRQFERMLLPPTVEVVDGGTGGFELIAHVLGKSKVIIIDAVQGDAEAGTVLRFTRDDLELQWRPSFSAHDDGIDRLLHLSKELLSPPEIIIYGVIPKETRRFSTSLSTEVNHCIPKIVGAVMKEIRAFIAQQNEAAAPI